MATGPEQLGKKGWRAERRPQGPGRDDGGGGGRECTKQLLKPGEGAKAKGGGGAPRTRSLNLGRAKK